MANAKRKGLTREETEAMKEALEERNSEKNEGEGAVLAKIARLPEPDRSLAKKVHAIIMKAGPTLTPRLWYGMPAYSSSEGKTICWFQDAHKFKARYASLGFSDKAKLDEGPMWPVAFAIGQLNASSEARIAALVKKAVGP